MTREDKLWICLKKVMGPPPTDLTPTAHLEADLGMDSLDLVELVMELEREFHIEVTEEQGDRLHTWGDVVKLVLRLTEQRKETLDGSHLGSTAGAGMPAAR